MMKKLLLLTLCVIAFSQTHAQDEKDYQKVKFGKVSPEDFNVKPSGKDSAAAAIALFQIGEMHFEVSSKGRWSYVLDVHKRIKIMNKEGYDYANFNIPIYTDGDYGESLNRVQVASYNLVNGKVEQNKAAKDEKFADEFNKNYTNYKYTLSNIQPGTIVEIKYQIQSDFLYTLRDWYFQGSIPIVWSDFSLRLPEYFKYKINIQSLTPVELISDKSSSEQFSGMLRGEGTAGSEPFNFSCLVEERRWVAKNVPAFKDEPYITTDDDYITKMDFEIQSEQYPGVAYHSYSTSWPKIAEGYSKADHFGEFIKPNGFSKKFVSTLVKEGDSKEQKAAAIFNFIKGNIKWNGSNGDYASTKNPKDLLDLKTGNDADLNLTLINLLQSADIKADPVVLSTRSNGRHPGYPLAAKFNYVIAAVTIDSNMFLLDATNPNYAPNIININALNHKGLLLDLNNYNGNWIMMDPSQFSTTSIVTNVTFDADLKLKGQEIIRKTLYDGLIEKRNYQKFSNQEDYLKDFKSNKNGLSIAKYTQDGFDKPSEPSLETFDFELSDYIEEAGNLVYFNPMLFDRTKQNPFKEDERKFPVDFAFPTLENYRVVVTLPEGYAIDKLPESTVVKLPDNSAVFSYSVTPAGNQLLINSKIALSRSEYAPEQYPQLRELFKQIVAKQAQPVVLKKL